MLFYFLLLPLALALTFAIVNSDIEAIYKQMLAFVPVLAVVAGIVGDFRQTRKEETDNENTD